MELGDFFVFLMILSPSAAGDPKVVAFMKDIVELPCGFHNLNNIAQQELLFFWQKEAPIQHEVLYENYFGNENLEYVAMQYRNRTILEPATWTLHLLDVHIKDEGLYTCHIRQKIKGWMQNIHQYRFQLSVLANYSDPKIDLLSTGTLKAGDDVQLMCFASQGYPKPLGILWLLLERNQTTELSGDMDFVRDNNTELYNITSKKTIKVTGPMKISCGLQFSGIQTEKLFSRVLPIELEGDYPESSTSRKHFLGILASAGAIGLVFLIIVVFLWKKNCCYEVSTDQGQIAKAAVNGQCESRAETQEEMLSGSDAIIL